MLRICALLLVVAGTAAAYPIAVPVKSGAVRADRERELRKRNAISLKTVEVGAHGFVKHVVIDDPGLVPKLTLGSNGWQWPDASVARVRDFLRTNADLMGFDPATPDRLVWAGNPSLLLVDNLDGAILGEIDVQVYGATLDITIMFWIDVQPKLTAAEIGARVVGASYAETIGYAEPPQLDCSMTRAGPAGCKTRIQHSRRRAVTLAESDVRAMTWLLPQGDKIRLVACVDADQLQDPEADPAWGNVVSSERRLAPRGKAPPLPLVVDLVTGETIAAHVASCVAPVFSDVRDRD